MTAQYKKNKKEWESTAKFWTQTYAMKGEGVSKQLKQLVDVSEQCVGQFTITNCVQMGFPEDKAKAALEKRNGDVNAALNDLFSA